MKNENNDPATGNGDDPGAELWKISLRALLTEIARRLSVRFGSISVAVHNGKPSTKVSVDHRELRDIE